MAIFASLNPHISGGGQPTPTKFGNVVEPSELYFHAKASLDQGHQFGAIHGEYMCERRKMAIFASLNPHISGGGQPTPTKFGKVVEPPGYIFAPKQDGIEQMTSAQ